MPRHFKVHELLDRSELDQLEEFAREPGRTVDECHEWLQARGYTIGRTAVMNWKGEFLSQDRFRASNEIARSLMDAAREKGTAAISDAAALQLSQLLFEQTLRMQSDGQLETKELMTASMALRNVIASKRQIDEVRERFDQQVKEAQGKRPGGVVTAEDIAEARKKIFG